MSLEKTVQMAQLFEQYKTLLTDKQCQVLSLYYDEDLSLAEIADIQGITRQGVHDNIRRAEKALLRYEKELQLNQKRLNRLNQYRQIIEETPNQAIMNIIKELIAEDE